MKDFKGTKGEWTVSNEKEDFRKPRVLNESNQVMFKHENCYDTDENNHFYYSHNKMKANANLIASSPELLKELIEMHNNSNAKTPLERERFYRVEKLINKALGQ